MEVTQNWSEENSNKFLQELNNYSHKNLTGATNLLADVLTDPATKSSFREEIWNIYIAYVTKLSDERSDEQQNTKAANESLKRVYDTLASDDTYHRNMLTNLASVNNYSLDTQKSGSAIPPIDKLPSTEISEPSKNTESTENSNEKFSAHARYPVSDTFEKSISPFFVPIVNPVKIQQQLG